MIPIIIDGKSCGELKIGREGAYMMLRGHASWSGDMVRLWLYGEGEPAYLGVLQPDGSVRRRYSLSEFSRLPRPIQYCADRPKAAEPASEEDVLWVRRPDGSLVHRDGQRGYIAFPAEGIRLPRGVKVPLREIEGETYVLFPW